MGYPEPLLKKVDRRDYLRTLLQSTLYKDIVKASQELHCDELWLLNDRSDRTETIQWQGVERRIRLMPLWQWLDR
jgi:hypothetical protein